jgi:hypothetical protein
VPGVWVGPREPSQSNGRTIPLYSTSPPSGAAIGVTFTLAVAVTVPAEFVAVNVYIVVTIGATIRLVRPVTIPTPWLIDSDVALETLHASVLDCPAVMLDGDVVKDVITGTAGVTAATITVVEAVAVPTPLLAVRV